MNKNHFNPSFNSVFINRETNQHSTSNQASSLREAYIKHDIDEYYQNFGHSYRNPHDLIVQEIVQLAWQKWSLNWHKSPRLSLWQWGSHSGFRENRHD
jgi:hypothetical protein